MLHSRIEKYSNIDINKLIIMYMATDDEQEREDIRTAITTIMIPVVKNIACKIARRSDDPVEDLTQAGFIGLLKAIDKYEPEKNDNFRVFAGYFIIGEIKHYIRDKLSMIRIPRHISELAIRIKNFSASLTIDEIRQLTSEDVASALNIPQKTVDIVMLADRRRNTISLEDLAEQDSNGYEDFIGGKDYKEKTKTEDDRLTFYNIIKNLSPEHKILIKLYYSQDMSKTEIANYLNWSKMRVIRELEEVFQKIYNYYNGVIEEDNKADE